MFLFEKGNEIKHCSGIQIAWLRSKHGVFPPIAICANDAPIHPRASGPKGLESLFSDLTLRNCKHGYLVYHRPNDTLALLEIMILACRVRISRRERYFEITEAGNRFAESRFPVSRETPLFRCICVYEHVSVYVLYMCRVFCESSWNRRYMSS